MPHLTPITPALRSLARDDDLSTTSSSSSSDVPSPQLTARQALASPRPALDGGPGDAKVHHILEMDLLLKLKDPEPEGAAWATKV